MTFQAKLCLLLIHVLFCIDVFLLSRMRIPNPGKDGVLRLAQSAI